MKRHLSNWLLALAAMACFAETIYAQEHHDPGPLLTAALGILLLPRALATTTPPAIVVLSGFVLTAVVVAGDHGLLDINQPAWIVITLIAFACFGFWERIERLWKHRRST
jgi:hypothetical protein